MRRLVLLAEHYRLSCLLLESREAAIFNKFQPVIAAMVPNLNGSDIVAITNDDNLNYAVDMPATPEKKARKVNIKALCHMGLSHIKELGEAGQAIRSNGIAHAIIQMIWAADPNPKKAYTTWMLSRFVGKDVANRPALEDLERTKGYLALYDRVKNRLPVEYRDINRIKSTADLFEIVRDYREDDKGEVVVQSHEQEMYRQAEVVYQGADYEIVIPKTMEASQFFGRGSEWCTAYAPPKTNNMFEHYNRYGPLYIVKDKSNGDMWQFQPGSDSYMDVMDRRINMQKFLTDHPKVKEIFDRYFGAEPPERLADYTVSGDTKYAYYRVENESGITLAVATEGWTPGGLIRTPARMEVSADKTGKVTGSNSRSALDPENRSPFIAMLEKLGFHGDCRWLQDNDIIWEGDRYNGFADLTPIDEAGGVQVRRVGDENEYKLHFSLGQGSEITNDLCELEVARNEFKYTSQNHQESIEDDDTRMALFTRIVLSQVDERLVFNRHNSSERLPRSEKLLSERPQWLDIAYLYAKQGNTPVLRERLVDWLVGEYDQASVDEGSNSIVMQTYSNISDFVEEEGNDTAKWVMKLSDGEERMDFSHEPDISYHQTDLLNSLKPDVLKRLCAYMASEHEDELEDIGLEEVSDVSDLETLIEEGYADELKSALETAVLSGDEAGAESEAHDSLRQAINQCSTIRFKKDDGTFVIANTGEDGKANWSWDDDIYVFATVEEIFKYLVGAADDVESEEPLRDGSYLRTIEEEFEVREPYYGFQGYDKGYAEERFDEAVHEFLPDEPN